jgi:1,4-dihydroxy-2-naphthoyl-CoA hydrolase
MSIWKSLRTPDQLNALHKGTMTEHLGIEFTELGADFVRARMPVNERTRQPDGVLHGGASVVLAETLGSTGAALCLDEQYQCVGQEINANHVRAVRTGLVTGTARAAHLGGRSQVWTIDIVNEEGKLVCTSRLTVAVIRRGSLGV